MLNGEKELAKSAQTPSINFLGSVEFRKDQSLKLSFFYIQRDKNAGHNLIFWMEYYTSENGAVTLFPTSTRLGTMET